MAATAVNGRIGPAKFIASKPNNVLLDDEMPEMDGLETVRELREINDRVPIIMFSMFSSLTERGAAVTLPCLNCVD
jgi:two-component system, chemotaxis family, protein-glutamate methylesterase/glutaminase